MERSEARQRREQQKSLIEENRRLAKEQAAKINYIDHEGTKLESFRSEKNIFSLHKSAYTSLF